MSDTERDLFRQQTKLIAELCTIIDCEAEDVGHGLGSPLAKLREIGPVNEKCERLLGLRP